MSFLKSSINLPAISTGTSLMKMSGGLGGGGATQMSPMESMKEVFLEIRDNTKQTVELSKVAVMGTAQERKEERIGAGDTDKEEKGWQLLTKAEVQFDLGDASLANDIIANSDKYDLFDFQLESFKDQHGSKLKNNL